MSDDPTVPITCPACETTTRVPLSDVAEAIDRHNASVHGGDAVAEVDPAITDHLADLIAEDLDLLGE
jgi:hypothetical protein